MRVIVYHTHYGCMTGCCGHVVELYDNDGEKVDRRFVFAHFYPDEYDDHKEFAKDLLISKFGEKHVEDLDWDNCLVLSSEEC